VLTSSEFQIALPGVGGRERRGEGGGGPDKKRNKNKTLSTGGRPKTFNIAYENTGNKTLSTKGPVTKDKGQGQRTRTKDKDKDKDKGQGTRTKDKDKGQVLPSFLLNKKDKHTKRAYFRLF
jgi:hypothetical protein